MESFPDQLKRQSKYFSRILKLSSMYIKQHASLCNLESYMAACLNEFSLYETSYNRAHLKAFADLLLNQSSATVQALYQIENFIYCFNCRDEIKMMQQLSTVQLKAVPPFNKEINAQFIQNAAVYQQNRQRCLKQSMINMSNTYMIYGAQLLYSAQNLRLYAQYINDTAPIVDIARKFAHLEMNVEICKLLKLTKQQFNEFDINSNSVTNATVFRRGSQMPKSLAQYYKNKNNNVNMMTSLKSGLSDDMGTAYLQQNSLEKQKINLKKDDKQLNYAPLNAYYVDIDNKLQQAAQNQNTYITNSLVNKFIDDDEPPTTIGNYLNPDYNAWPKAEPTHKHPKTSPHPQIKQYSFSDSLFDEESDHLEFKADKNHIDYEYCQPANDLVYLKAKNADAAKQVDYTQKLSSDLQKYMDEMKNMLSQLTDQPTSTDQPAKVQYKPKVLPKPIARYYQNDTFANQIKKAITGAEEQNEPEGPEY